VPGLRASVTTREFIILVTRDASDPWCPSTSTVIPQCASQRLHVRWMVTDINRKLAFATRHGIRIGVCLQACVAKERRRRLRATPQPTQWLVIARWYRILRCARTSWSSAEAKRIRHPTGQQANRVSLSNDKIDGVDRAINRMLRLDGRRSKPLDGTSTRHRRIGCRQSHSPPRGGVGHARRGRHRLQAFGHRELAFAMLRVTGRSVLSLTSELAKLPETIGVTAVIDVSTSSFRYWDETVGTWPSSLEGCSASERIDSINGHIALTY